MTMRKKTYLKRKKNPSTSKYQETDSSKLKKKKNQKPI